MLPKEFNQCDNAPISRWMSKAPRDPEPAKRWLTFLRNHREAIAAMDFFTVPNVDFSVLSCLFIISHDRRRILHFNVTRHPKSKWIVQQLFERPRDSDPKWEPIVRLLRRFAHQGRTLAHNIESLLSHGVALSHCQYSFGLLTLWRKCIESNILKMQARCTVRVWPRR